MKKLIILMVLYSSLSAEWTMTNSNGNVLMYNKESGQVYRFSSGRFLPVTYVSESEYKKENGFKESKKLNFQPIDSKKKGWLGT